MALMGCCASLWAGSPITIEPLCHVRFEPVVWGSTDPAEQVQMLTGNDGGVAGASGVRPAGRGIELRGPRDGGNHVVLVTAQDASYVVPNQFRSSLPGHARRGAARGCHFHIHQTEGLLLLFRASVTSSSTGRGMVSIRRPASASPHGRGASHIGPHRGAFGQLEDHPLDPAIVDCGAEDHGGPNSTIRIQCPPYAQRRAYPARLNVRQTRQARLRTCPQIAAYAVAWWLEPHHCKWR